MPRTETRTQTESVLINTAGGLTGGDDLYIESHWLPGTTACLTTQAAEKIYRAADSKANVRTRLFVESGADAEWLPQETILFNRSALDRCLDVNLAGGSKFLGLETLVFGRQAMGEEVVAGFVRDAWRIRRDGRLVYADCFQLSGEIAAELNRNPVAAGARTYGKILLVADEIAPDLLHMVRDILPSSGLRAAASSWNGILAVRFLAPDGQLLRRAIADVLSVLRQGKGLPRVWRC